MSSETGSARDGSKSHASGQFGSAIEQSWYHHRIAATGDVEKAGTKELGGLGC